MINRGYTLVEISDRIHAVDHDGVEICGAYQPAGHDYWQLYTTKLITKVTGLPTPPHREHYWGNNGRADSKRWVELIANLYSLAVQAEQRVA